MKLIDSHCHLVDEKLWPEADIYIKRALGAGVEKFVTMAGGRSEWPKLVSLSEKYSEVYIALGWHPEDITKDESLVDLERLIVETPKCVAIGEVGLDFYYDKEKLSKEIQIKMIKKQIELAIKLQKKLVIHSRNAEEEMEEVLEMYKGKFLAQFHCFGESADFLRKILNGGHMVSFGGNITFKSANNLREMLRIVPKEQLLLETDSPYLTPEPLRGSLNEPANLVHTAHFIAKELKIELLDLTETTYNNTVCFFGLEN